MSDMTPEEFERWADEMDRRAAAGLESAMEERRAAHRAQVDADLARKKV